MKKKKLKLNPAIIILVLTSTILSACGSRPHNVLSEEKMEDVLFDLYIAESEIEDNYALFGNDSLKKQEFLDAVLKKHEISEQHLDTSLVWYAGNLEKYFKIHERLEKRYATLADTLRAQLELKSLATADLNLVNIWKGDSGYVLRSAALLENKLTFRIDSADFQKNDSYELRFEILGLRDSTIQPQVTFCAQCPDTTFIFRGNVTQNGRYTAYLSSFGRQKTKALFGTVYIPEKHKGVCITIHHFGIFQRKIAILEKPTMGKRARVN